MSMRVRIVKVDKVIIPYDRYEVIFASLKNLHNTDILAISSKVVSLSEAQVASKAKISRDDLIISQAERYIPRDKIPGRQGILTVKNHALTIAAGVDEFDGSYVLWSEDPQASARRIWKFLKKKFRLKKLGVIITDSHTVPLRRGLVGFALGYYGFAPLRTYAGRKNLFGRKMKITQANLADGLASAAVVVMGEGGERTPLAVISGVEGIRFINKAYQTGNPLERFEVPLKEDLFYPLLSGTMWKGKNQSKF